jgi:hypothetical protein
MCFVCMIGGPSETKVRMHLSAYPQDDENACFHRVVKCKLMLRVCLSAYVRFFDVTFVQSLISPIEGFSAHCVVRPCVLLLFCLDALQLQTMPQV